METRRILLFIISVVAITFIIVRFITISNTISKNSTLNTTIHDTIIVTKIDTIQVRSE